MSSPGEKDLEIRLHGGEGGREQLLLRVDLTRPRHPHIRQIGWIEGRHGV